MAVERTYLMLKPDCIQRGLMGEVIARIERKGYKIVDAKMMNLDEAIPVSYTHLPDGEKGELVFTSISKKAFPLLRYRTRDICILSREKCLCGRTHVRMTKPLGRTDDMLIVRGVNVFPTQIETVLMNNGYAANYQIIVDRENNNDTLDVHIEMTPRCV